MRRWAGTSAVAGDERLRRAKLKLPRQLSLAREAKLERASKVKADGKRVGERRIKRRKRVLSVKLKGGANRVRAKLGKGALRRNGKLGARPRFRAVLTDVTGKPYRLNVRPK